ncbi:High-affinity nickel-transport protein [Leminorella richardii]|uniref:Nickel/cobalt efflux system n=1 Tax=Leminorella richardii TaxID=158841 RepID=A0A2X4UPV8_9GAMM|nr:nickel/cobalt transporter [Leminorella richardii]SQI36642.1 High-affinity nickel-transport protein [Leminorella richardii]
MSLNTVSVRTTSGGWRTLWPLLLCSVILLMLGVSLWLNWQEALLQSSLWQKALHQRLVSLLQQVVENPLGAGATLMFFSFLYGVLHSAGPGHGKVIIATYLATHPLRLKQSLRLTLASSLVQGLVAIVLVTVVLSVLQLSARMVHQSNFWLEKGSYLLVVLIGLMLCYRAGKQIVTVVRVSRRGAPRISAIRPLEQGHVHGPHCGCGHRHLPTAEEIEATGGWKTSLAIIFSIGIRPCSGAILVLLFSKVLDIYYWGMAAAIAMSFGTATTISLLALLVHSARRLAQRLMAQGNRGTSAAWSSVAVSSLSLLGGAILMIAGLMLWLSATPAASGGLRAFGG